MKKTILISMSTFINFQKGFLNNVPVWLASFGDEVCRGFEAAVLYHTEPSARLKFRNTKQSSFLVAPTNV